MKRILLICTLLFGALSGIAQSDNFKWIKQQVWIAAGTDTYTVASMPGMNSYVNGFEPKILFTNANTGTASLNINGLGAKTIKKNGSTNLSAGDIPAGTTMRLSYDGTNFQLLGSAGSGGGGMVYPGAGIAVSTGAAWGTSLTDNSTLWNNAIAKTGTTTFTGDVTIDGNDFDLNLNLSGTGNSAFYIRDFVTNIIFGSTYDFTQSFHPFTSPYTGNVGFFSDRANTSINLGIRNGSFSWRGIEIRATSTDDANITFTPKAGEIRIYNPANTFYYTIGRGAIAANRTLSLPLLTGNDTFVTQDFTQTLTNKTLTSPVINTQISGNITSGGNITTTNYLIGATATQTLTSKTFAIGSNTFSGTTAQFNTALSDNDFATLAGTESLSNKTLGAGTFWSANPTITDGLTIVFNPNGTQSGFNFGSHTANPSVGNPGDAFYNSTNNEVMLNDGNWRAAVLKDQTQTLTNKTLNLSSNTLTGTKAQFNTAVSDGDFEDVANKATALTTMNSTLYPTTAALFEDRTVTGTDAIVQSDNGKTIYFNSATNFNFTIDQLTIKSQVGFVNIGTGTVTFVNGTGVTFTGSSTLNGNNSSGGIIYRSATAPIIFASTAANTENDNPDIRYEESTDFYEVIAGGDGFSYGNSGAGSGIVTSDYGVNSTERALGVMSLNTGTTTTGAAWLWKGGGGGPKNIMFGTSNITWLWRSALSAVSDGTNTYSVTLGFGESSNAKDQTDGAYFTYTHSASSGNWECVTASGGTRTTTNSGVAASTSYQQFRIAINDTGTQVLFYIDAALVATHTTNIPTTGTLFVGNIVKTAGTTSRVLYNDYYKLITTRNSVR